MLIFKRALTKIALVAVVTAMPVLASASNTQYLQWGNQMLQAKQYDKALQYFGAAAKSDQRDAAAYKGLGYASMGKKDVTNGIKYMDYSLQLNPGDNGLRRYLGQTYQGYGNQYYQRGDKTSAMAWWNKAVQTDPSNTQLAAYLNNLRAQNATQQAQAAPPKANPKEEKQGGVNPWAMGGTVALLGAIMLFVF